MLINSFNVIRVSRFSVLLQLKFRLGRQLVEAHGRRSDGSIER